MKKIGLIALAVVLAVGGLGIGYAAWTDTITIEGTVDTGDVNIDIWGYSETDVYKGPDDECVAIYTAMNLDGTVLYHSINDGAIQMGAPDLTNLLLIASAHVTSINHANNTVTVDYDNLFPCICFATDLLLHYNGSIPVKVNTDTFTTGYPWLQKLVDDGDMDSGAVRVTMGTDGIPVPGETVDIGTQLHECDFVLLVMGIHIPQDDTLMNKSGSATYTIEVVQWNEYPYPPGT